MKKVLIDLFCGIGGFSWGFHKNGYEVLLAVDAWENALRIHEFHHPNAIHSTTKIGTPKSRQYITQFIKDNVDFNTTHLHIHASPPCQQLSTANNIREENTGVDLTNWTINLMLYLKKVYPKLTWSIEQVQNARLKEIATKKKLHWKVFLMSNYGVCQHRKRLIISSHDIDSVMPESKPTSIEKLLNLESKVHYITNTTYLPTTVFKENSFIPSIAKIVPNETYSYTVIKKPNWFLDKNKNAIRRFSLSDVTKLQTFPIRYITTKMINDIGLTQGDHYQMIANAVPPHFAYQISKALDKYIV